MSEEWRDRLAGARMQVDQQFTDQVVNSQFSNQQWGLIMTAVEFDIDEPEQPEEASLVANTEHVDQILPELDNIDRGMGGVQPGGGGESSGGGIIDSIGKLVPGMGGDDSGVDEDQKAAAISLTEEYATQLQQYLESNGRWAGICESAAASQSGTDRD
jgi:hypothetical protein